MKRMHASVGQRLYRKTFHWINNGGFSNNPIFLTLNIWQADQCYQFPPLFDNYISNRHNRFA